MGDGRGRLTIPTLRVKILELIQEAIDAGARQILACEIIGISSKTFQRWQKESDHKDGRHDVVHMPKNKITAEERQKVIDTLNSSEFANLPPSQIIPILADRGIWIASEATFYRIMREEKLNKHRLKSKPNRNIKKPRALKATGPNQVYTWDITYLPTRVKGQFYYLYLMMDIFSRKIVGWQIHHNESTAYAADLIKDICLREKIDKDQVVLHSDNGSPMKGATMLATLQELGIMPSFSRPSVSNDNPYSESIFRTLKYRPEYPDKPFKSISDAREWVDSFANWYNTEHRHSSIKFVTPDQRHQGLDKEILLKRSKLYEAKRALNPSRWPKKIRNWEYIKEVHLNPAKSKIEIKIEKEA